MWGRESKAKSTVADKLARSILKLTFQERPLTEIFYGFFSYAHADAKTDKALFDAFSDELALRLTNQFTDRTQARLWKDADLRTGEIWDPRIEANLRDSKFLVVMLSPQWLASDYCRKEFAIFLEEEAKRGAKELIIPILVRDTESKKDELTGEKREIYEKLSARQYKSARVTQFYKLTHEQRNLEIEALAEEIYPRVKPFIRKPEPLPAPVTVATAPPTLAVLPPHNLPLKSLGRLFMGRDAFMADLEAKLRGDGAAAVTEGVLQGMGGVGKTRLAIEYAWRHAKDYRALLFVSAETPGTLATGLAALAATLNLPEQEAPQDPVKREAVLRWFARERGWLLILDNVDDEKAAAAVAGLLPQLANGVTLITARYDGFPANIETMPLGVLKPEPARDFLLARTKGRRRDASDDAARAEELAKELGYLALALEQAGAFICAQRISFERYLAYWRDERARVVDWFDKTAMGTNHDKGLAAVFATSVARLSPNGRRLLDRVAFLAPEPIPDFLLDVPLLSSFETPPAAAPQDEGSGAAPPFSHEMGEGATQSATDEGGAATETEPPSPDPTASGHPLPLRGRGEDAPFDARAALAELYAYSLAAPTEIDDEYARHAFVVHRLVQDYARSTLQMSSDTMAIEVTEWLLIAILKSNIELIAGDINLSRAVISPHLYLMQNTIFNIFPEFSLILSVKHVLFIAEYAMAKANLATNKQVKVDFIRIALDMQFGIDKIMKRASSKTQNIAGSYFEALVDAGATEADATAKVAAALRGE